LFQLRALDEDSHSRYRRGTVFSLTTPIWRVGDAALFASRLAKEWGATDRITFKGKYFGLEGRALTVIDEDRSSMSYARISQTDTVDLQFEATVDEVQSNTEELLRSALAPLYAAFDFYEPPMELFIQEVSKLKTGRF
jgi:hypothetical protein